MKCTITPMQMYDHTMLHRPGKYCLEARQNTKSRHYLEVCFMEKRKCDWNSGYFSPFLKLGGFFSIKTCNGRLFRYYMMVRSLGRPHHGGKILYTDIFRFCRNHQHTELSSYDSQCISHTLLKNISTLVLLAKDFHTI